VVYTEHPRYPIHPAKDTPSLPSHRGKLPLGDKLRQRCEEIGQPELYGKIADETICTELEPLIEHLAAVEHPALALGEMI
jgi:hypothetical protein